MKPDMTTISKQITINGHKFRHDVTRCCVAANGIGFKIETCTDPKPLAFSLRFGKKLSNSLAAAQPQIGLFLLKRVKVNYKTT